MPLLWYASEPLETELAVAPVARLSPSQSWRFSSFNHQASFAGLERGLETQELCPQFFEYVTVCT